MAQGLMQFKIVLDSPDCEFSPGEIVTGKVIVELGRPKSIRGLKVRAKGTAEVRWSESSGSGKDETSTTYSNSEQYFRTEFYLIGGSGGDNIEIPPGHHEYPFNFCLPRNIPSSFETTHGNVRYAIKATMDRPWKFDHQTTMLFTVVTPFDLSQCSGAQVPIDDENVETFCCFPCITMGKMQTHFHMRTSGFAVGEVLNAKIDINNHSTSVDVTGVKLILEQKIKLEARTKTKKSTHVVQEARKSGPFPKKAEIMMNMQVPAVPLSNLPFCTIIDVQYRVIAKISVSGCHCASKNSYPIVIGTKPTVGSRPTNTPVVPAIINNSSSFGVPTAPFLSDGSPTPTGAIPFPMPMIDQRFNNPIPVGANPTGDIYPPPIPRISNPGFQYPPSAGGPPIGFVDPGPMGSTTAFTEKPPPSYDDCLKMAKNN